LKKKSILSSPSVSDYLKESRKAQTMSLVRFPLPHTMIILCADDRMLS